MNNGMMEWLARRCAWVKGIVAASFLLYTLDAYPLPEGGTITGGNGNISQSGNTVRITQNTPKMIIDWRGFNTATGEFVNFLQPGAGAIALNRINSGLPTTFAGVLTANGQVWIVNPAGVLFTSTSKIDVGSLLVSTANITNNDFLQGNYHFQAVPGFLNRSIINEGQIIARGGDAAGNGLVALVAPGVENRGVIQANLGQVVLASGTAFILDLYGDELIHFTADSKVMETPVDTQGNALKDAVANNGVIQANGGKVLLTANTAGQVVNNVVSMNGVIEAKTVNQTKGGVVILGGDEGTVQVSGKIDASAAEARGDGGTIIIKGHKTVINGNLSARAGSEGGKGGFVETSGHYLDLNDMQLDVIAPAGEGGTWLIDPYNIIINNCASTSSCGIGATTSFMDAGIIGGQLTSGTNVVVTTAGPGAALRGDIVVNNNVISTGSGNLLFQAGGSVTVNANIDVNNGDFTIQSGLQATAAGQGNVLFNAVGITAHDILIAASEGSITGTPGTLVTGNSLLLTAQGGITLPQTSVNYLEATNTGGNILIGQSGTPTLTVGKLEQIGGGDASIQVNGGGDLIINAPDITVDGGALTFLASNNGNITVNTPINNTGINDGSLGISGGNDVTLNQAINFRGNVTLAGQLLTINAPVTVLGSGNILNLSSSGVITQNSGGILTAPLATIQSTNGIQLTADNLLNEITVINSATGNIDIVNNQGLDLNVVSQTGGGNINITAAGDIHIIDNPFDIGIVTDGGNVNLTASGTGGVTIDEPIVKSTSAAGNLTIIAPGNIAVNQPITFDGDVVLFSTSNSVNVNAPITVTTAPHQVAITGNDTVAQTSSGIITSPLLNVGAKNGINLTANNLLDQLVATNDTSGNIDIYNDQGLDIVNAVMQTGGTGNVNITANGNLTVSGAIITDGGDFQLTATANGLQAGDIAINAVINKNNAATAGQLILQGDGAITINQPVNFSNGNMSITSTNGTVDFNAPVYLGSTGTTLTVVANGTVDQTNSGILTADLADITALGGINLSANNFLARLIAVNNGGDIVVNNNQALDVNGIAQTGGGSVNVTAGVGDLALSSGGIVTDGGNITLNAATGNIVLQTDANAGSGDIIFNAPTVLLEGDVPDILLSGSNIIFNNTLDSSAAGSGNETLTINGNAQFNDAIGSIKPFASLTINGATALNAGSVTTAGNQTYNGTLTLNQNLVLNAGNAGNILFNAAVNGSAFDLTIDMANDVIGNGAIQVQNFVQNDGAGNSDFSGGVTAGNTIAINTNNITGGIFNGNLVFLQGFDGILGSVTAGQLFLGGLNGGNLTNSQVGGISGIGAATITQLLPGSAGDFYVNGCLAGTSCTTPVPPVPPVPPVNPVTPGEFPQIPNELTPNPLAPINPFQNNNEIVISDDLRDPVGIVACLTGFAVAVEPDGSQKILMPGDHVYANEKIVTDEESRVKLRYLDGRQVEIGTGQTYPVAG